MVREYEVTFILSPTLDESAFEAQCAKLAELVEREGGKIQEWDKWGKRRLAYPIKGETDGQYAFLRFEADPACIEKLGQAYKLDENILRHVHILKED